MNLFINFLKILILSMLLFGCAYETRKKETFARQIGTYIFDINRTNLGEYKKNSIIYKNLKISFNEDSKFIMNMRVPFFADSVGTWIAGDGLANSYNQLYFNNKDYQNVEGSQFFPPYLNGNDTVFLINGASPTKNQPHIQKIYFKKIRE